MPNKPPQPHMINTPLLIILSALCIHSLFQLRGGWTATDRFSRCAQPVHACCHGFEPQMPTCDVSTPYQHAKYAQRRLSRCSQMSHVRSLGCDPQLPICESIYPYRPVMLTIQRCSNPAVCGATLTRRTPPPTSRNDG